MRAVNKISGMIYKAEAFTAGLKAIGFEVVDSIQWPEPSDVLVLWNRTSRDEELARKFEAAGARVLIAENGYMGKTYAGHRWFAVSLNHHNGAGWTPSLGGGRMRQYCEGLAQWRDGQEIIALPQRGIGEAWVAMPRDWRPPEGCRVRRHPGTAKCTPIEHDLANAFAVVTWGSGAAIKALAFGVPCFHAFPQWIASGASTLLPADITKPVLHDRVPTFERIFNAMWTQSEIESGVALCQYLSR